VHPTVRSGRLSRDAVQPSADMPRWSWYPREVRRTLTFRPDAAF
jgi:hypothetical protein